MNPKLICLTPVRNEAWILDLFLSYTSKWADYIIIADQNSTDGSKQIALKYPKVVLVENDSPDYNEASRQKLLINEARKIHGSKILFTLDADEFFSVNFAETEDWRKIINSKPGDVFGFNWVNINPDRETYFTSDFYYPWVVNDDGCEHKQYVKSIHSMRIPFPDSANFGWKHVTQFNVLHLNWISEDRIISKNRYYQCLHYILDSAETPNSLYRSYNRINKCNIRLPRHWVSGEQGCILDKIDISNTEFWWDQEVIKIILKQGVEKMKYIAIWDDEKFNQKLRQNSIQDAREYYLILYHYYLKKSQSLSRWYLIKMLDKVFAYLLTN